MSRDLWQTLDRLLLLEANARRAKQGRDVLVTQLGEAGQKQL